MMKKLYILFSILIITTTCLSQSCLPEGITFSTQEQIDNFQANYPGCSKILGNVWIKFGITNLNGLSSIQVIGGYLRIADTDNLQNLDGLESLDSIGTILNEYGNFGGLSIGTGGRGGITYPNESLSNIDGLSGLSYVGSWVYIAYNPLLENLDGLIYITSIEGSLSIQENNNLTDLNGLINLTSIEGSLSIQENNNLTDLNGLNNLTSIGGGLGIYYNNNLTDLNGLINITSIGYVLIVENDNLTDLNGLINITSINDDLEIEGNSNLSECEVQSICAYLENPNGGTSISDNAIGCNSVEEVENACNAVGINEKVLFSNVSIYPNPNTGFINIDLGSLTDVSINVINVSGRLIYYKENINSPTYQFELDAAPGIYILELSAEGEKQQFKLIKQ